MMEWIAKTAVVLLLIFIVMAILGVGGMDEKAKGCYKSVREGVREGTILDQVDQWGGVETSSTTKEKTNE